MPGSLTWYPAELQAVPKTGAAWDRFIALTDTDPAPGNFADQDLFAPSHLYCQAIRWAIDGTGPGRSAIIADILAWPATSAPGVNSLGVYRQMAALVAAADLVDLGPGTAVTDYDGSSTTWAAWLETMVTRPTQHPRWTTIRNTAYGFTNARASYSNYGSWARAAYMAIGAYLDAHTGNDTYYVEALDALRQFLGTDRGLVGYEAAIDFDANWVDGGSFPNSDGRRFAINPATSVDALNGIIYEDAARGGGPPVLAPAGVSYSCESWEASAAAAVFAYHNGYAQIFAEADSALDRAMARLFRDGDLNDTTYSQFHKVVRPLPWVANQVYGTNWPTVTAPAEGRFFREVDALTASGSTWLTPAGASPTDPDAPHLSFDLRTVLVGGNPTNQGQPAEGLLLNSRMVQATVDHTDQAPSWDADANTQAFIDHLPTYRQAGLNAATINLQGGLYRRPFGEAYDAGAWNPDGTMRAAHQARLIAVVEAMIDLGMVPIVGLFYFRQDQMVNHQPLSSNFATSVGAVKTAVDTAMAVLAPYQDAVIVEVVNEASHGLVDQPWLTDTNVAGVVAYLVDNGYYASFSLTPGAIPSTSQLGPASVCFLHCNNRTAAQVTSMVNTAKTRFPGLPIIINEDGPSDANSSYTAAEYVAHMRAAVAAGAGWGYYDQSGFQEACDSPNSGDWQCSAPDLDATGIDWGLTTTTKQAVFAEFAAQGGGAATPEPPDGTFLEDGTGVVVMEVESVQNPAGSLWSPVLTADGGYFGGGYRRWDGPARLGGPGTDSTLLFRFNVDTAGGAWWIGLHSRRDGTGAGDEHNDLWMKVNADDWHKYWQRGGTHEVWETDHRFEIGGVNVDPISGVAGVPNIVTGLNEIRITGRSEQFQIDRLVLVHDPGGVPTLADFDAHLADPESEIQTGSQEPPPDPSPEDTDHVRTIPGGGFALLSRAPGGGVGEGQTFVRTITDGVVLGDALVYVAGTEDWPTPGTIHTPSDGRTLRQAILDSGNGVVELADGNYGADDSCANTTGLQGAYVFSRSGGPRAADKTAIFRGNHTQDVFFGNQNDVTLRNFGIEAFGLDGGNVRYDGRKVNAAMINWDSSSGVLAWDMAVGRSKMNGIVLKGGNSEIRGGEIYDCHRFAFTGANNNMRVGGSDWGPIYFRKISWNTSPDILDPSQTIGETGNRGICKIAVAGNNWVCEDWDVDEAWNGCWFDIANEPAIIRRLRLRRVQQNGVFIEVSYGVGGAGKRWLVEDVISSDGHHTKKGATPANFPVPAVALTSLTPDIDFRRIQGDGQEFCTVGIHQWNHPQLNNLNHSRMGVSGITVTESVLAGYGYSAGYNLATRMGSLNEIPRPVFENNNYGGSRQFRWIDQDLTMAGWTALGHS